jgi:hypothetical protein
MHVCSDVFRQAAFGRPAKTPCFKLDRSVAANTQRRHISGRIRAFHSGEDGHGISKYDLRLLTWIDKAS